MKDFEVLPRGSTEEIRLSRELMKVMNQTAESYGKGIFPSNVIIWFDALNAHHVKQIESEQYD